VALCWALAAASALSVPALERMRAKGSVVIAQPCLEIASTPPRLLTSVTTGRGAMSMQANTSTARAIVALVRKCGPMIAREKDPVIQREALAELVSLYLLGLPEAERDAGLAHITNTARELAKMRAR
jgi:hypothetical protein